MTAHSVTPANDRLLRADQVLAIFAEYGLDDLDETFLSNQCRTRAIPFTKVAGKRRFLESGVRAYIDSLLKAAA